jgi:hypothetical protein
MKNGIKSMMPNDITGLERVKVHPRIGNEAPEVE